MTETIKLENTIDFDQFKVLELNRNISRPQVIKLSKLIKETPLLTLQVPILVNDKNEVIDGQHRLAAHKEILLKEGLAIPIYYITRPDLGIEVARSLNSGVKIWQSEDYARVFAGQGNKDYQTFMKVFNTKTFSPDTIRRYLAGYNVKGAEFREGRFKIKDYDKSMTHFQQLEDVGQVIEAERIGDINYWQNRCFTGAIYYLFEAPNYDHDFMLLQLQKYGNLLRPVKVSTFALLYTLKTIYNKGNVDKITLKNKLVKMWESSQKV